MAVTINGTTGIDIGNTPVSNASTVDVENHLTVGRTSMLPFGGANTRTLQVGDGSSVVQFVGATESYIYNAAYFDGTNSKRQTSVSIPSRQTVSAGTFTWQSAPIGATDSIISPWNTSMVLDSSGNLTTAGVITSNSGIHSNGDITFDTGAQQGRISQDLYKTTFSIGSNSGEWSWSDQNNESMYLSNAGVLSVYGSAHLGYNQTTGVYSGGTSTGVTVYAGDANNYSQLVARTTSAGSFFLLNCVTGGVRRASINDSGTFASATNVYGSTSDIKLKENIVDTTPKLDKLMQVKVRNFNYIGAEEKQIGVIAQEIEQIFPGVVYETEDEVLTEVTKTREITLEDGTVTTEEYLTEEMQPNGEFTKNVKYSVIYMMMLKGMQEQNEIIKDLKARVIELENK